MLRLFVALDVPNEIRATLAATSEQADSHTWRAVPEESLHITLAFLGPRPPEDVDLIAPIIRAEHAAPELTLGNVLVLSRVLAVEVHGPLHALQARVSQQLEAAGVYTPESRPYRAHVTIARLRPRTRPPRDSPLTVEHTSFQGQAVTLYASRLHPGGARYEALESASLGYIQP